MAVAALILLAVLVVLGYIFWPKNKNCPSTIHRNADGSLTLKPSGRVFSDMNEFQQWWHSSGENAVCPIPVLTGHQKGEVVLTGQQNGWGTEQTYAKTPIYKVDDYEFSRIFGYERDGRMDVPRQNFNVLLTERFFDWADRPLTSDERKHKYAGLKEGFTADGTLSSVEEARSRYGEGGMPYPTGGPRSMSPGREYELCKKAAKICTYDDEHDAWPTDLEKRTLCIEARAVCRRDDMPWPSNNGSDDDDCKVTRKEKEVAKLVAKAYESDPDYEPVVTKVGANNWEVTELKPRHRKQPYDDRVDERVVNTDNEQVDLEFRYRDKEAIERAVDPFYEGIGSVPFDGPVNKKDPFYGPVPGLERPFGPTFDHTKQWY
jgi:hypothetical protein